MADFDKWKKAVIHLECAADSEHLYDRLEKIDELRKEVEKGRISREQFAEKQSDILSQSRDLRKQGTALFFADEGKRYLLTARHVVWDKRSGNREKQEQLKRFSHSGRKLFPRQIKSINEEAQNKIFSPIFRVPTLDEILDEGVDSPQECLMNLGAGPFSLQPYTFSSPEYDLAIVSLDQRDSRFAEELENAGYEPVSSDVFSDGPPEEGAEIFTVGYPGSTAILGEVSQHPAREKWSSKCFSLPVFAFGRVSMRHSELPFFWGDISIYPGNSGGPVIHGDNLVGLISKQATLPHDQVPDFRTRIPFGKIMKSDAIFPLLDSQKEKDRREMELRER